MWKAHEEESDGVGSRAILISWFFDTTFAAHEIRIMPKRWIRCRDAYYTGINRILPQVRPASLFRARRRSTIKSRMSPRGVNNNQRLWLFVQDSFFNFSIIYVARSPVVWSPVFQTFFVFAAMGRFRLSSPMKPSIVSTRRWNSTHAIFHDVSEDYLHLPVSLYGESFDGVLCYCAI